MREVGEGKMQHILSLSYGKDSMACLGAIEELGWPLDRIVHAEVWATDKIPADLPPMVEFKAKADVAIKDRFGIDVEHFVAKRADGVFADHVSFEDCFYRKMTSGKSIGRIKGFPMVKGSWCVKLKLNALKHIEKSCFEKNIQYLGIAINEPTRLDRLDGRLKLSPLAALGWTEDDCRRWCEKNGLLSPIYTTATRGGCWFCHNQSVDQLRLLRKNYPEYWALMMKWDRDSPVTFHADGHTVQDFDRRFKLEDLGLIPADRKFRWDMCNQLNLFELMEETDNFA